MTARNREPSKKGGGDPTRIRKMSVCLDGHKTSVSLEGFFIQSLKDFARRDRTTLCGLISAVDRWRFGAGFGGNLSSCLRLYTGLRLRGHQNTTRGLQTLLQRPKDGAGASGGF